MKTRQDMRNYAEELIKGYNLRGPQETAMRTRAEIVRPNNTGMIILNDLAELFIDIQNTGEPEKQDYTRGGPMGTSRRFRGRHHQPFKCGPSRRSTQT